MIHGELFPFTFAEIERQYRSVQEMGYEFITCAEYAQRKADLPARTVVNRIDVDFSIERTGQLLDVLRRVGLKATFFVRLHAKEYNPLSFEFQRILAQMIHDGHEVGYHSEIIDAAAILEVDPEEVLRTDLKLLSLMTGHPVTGVASHGGNTGLNNLDFWKDRRPAEFGLAYEAYDQESGFDLFENSRYVSDSEWVRWKAYNNGQLLEGDRRSFEEHASEGHPLIYLLIHPDTYYDRHPYE
jgi:peptidoglycan/xylan/chitin deacetylase (PgdA/CDA1 family)